MCPSSSTEPKSVKFPPTQVRIVGAGLIGTSIGLGLVQHGVSVEMIDSDPASQSLASDLIGGGSVGQPQLVILALPTNRLDEVLNREFKLNPQSTFMDVGSVKTEVLLKVEGVAGLASRFVPPESLQTVEALITLLGATALKMSPADHDAAVAKVSHLPQIFSSLLAKQLVGTKQEWMELSGQGLRDSTRIAGSDPNLWKQIIFSNREALSGLLKGLRDDVQLMIDSLENANQIEKILEQGRSGRDLIPGKHGGKAREYSYLPIVIDDKPGQFASIFNLCATLDVNVEDLGIEHSPGQLNALITLALSPSDAQKLSNHLASIGWNVHPIRN